MRQSGHKLRIPQDAAALIQGLHPHLKRKIKSALRMILTAPNSGKALQDELAGLRSLRVGKLRIIYRLSGKEVQIVALGPRKRVYEETYRLILKGK